MPIPAAAALLLSIGCLPLFSQFNAGNWNTDRSKKSIALAELSGGGPPKDGIPAIDQPRFVPVTEAPWLDPRELVIAFEHGGEARAYPLQILIWHELVNDEFGGLPVLVSYCPLCNSALVFDRRLNGQTLVFGVSGMLRNSDMVMFDRQTDSLWQQITGEGIVGEHTGRLLKVLPSQLISFADFRSAYPRGRILSRPAGDQRAYGRNPYQGYEFNHRPIAPFEQRRQTSLRPMDKLVVLREKKGYRAYPVKVLAARGVWEDKVDGRPIVLFYTPAGASPVDAAAMAESRPVGSVGVFAASRNGERIRFRRTKNGIADRSTASSWTITGTAVDGPRKGERLEQVPHGLFFSFAWLAFEPGTAIIGGFADAQEPPVGLPVEGRRPDQ